MKMKQKQFAKRIICFLFVTMLLISKSDIPASAADIPNNGYPSINYGSNSRETIYEWLMGPYYQQGWHQVAEYRFYSDWDSDVFNCYQSSSNNALTLSTTSTFSITGGMKYKFSEFVEGNLNITVGDTWTRTSSVTYAAEAGYKYTLWAANVLLEQKFYYGNTFVEATLFNKGGSEKWFFRQAL